MTICKIGMSNIYANDKRKKFEYIPSNSKYDAILIEWWWRCDVPYAYEVINKTDIMLYYKNGRMKPLLFQRKYLPLLRKYLLKDWKKSVILKKVKFNNGETLATLMRELDITYLRIAYPSSRTITMAHTRPLLAYAKAFSGAVIIFKKRGGYLAYHITRVGMGNKWGWNNATQITDLLDAINLLKKIREEKMGKVFLPKKIEEEIKDHVFLERL